MKQRFLTPLEINKEREPEGRARMFKFKPERIKNKRFLTGFTLIELVLVIALIGLLIVLIVAGISKQRMEAKDTRVKVIMNQLRLEATMIYHQYGNYDLFCCENGCKEEVRIHCGDINKMTGGNPIIHSSGSQYCVFLLLNNDNYFCIDDTGLANEFEVNYCSETHQSCSP